MTISPPPRHYSGSLTRNASCPLMSAHMAGQRLPTRFTGPPRFIGVPRRTPTPGAPTPGVTTARATGRATSLTPGLTMQPVGVGDGYYRAMALRKAARTQAGVFWTIEQVRNDSWPRAWKFLEPEFADCDPNTIEPEHFLAIDRVTGSR
jgi:hypothetical protein